MACSPGMVRIGRYTDCYSQLCDNFVWLVTSPFPVYRPYLPPSTLVVRLASSSQRLFRLQRHNYHKGFKRGRLTASRAYLRRAPIYMDPFVKHCRSCMDQGMFWLLFKWSLPWFLRLSEFIFRWGSFLYSTCSITFAKLGNLLKYTSQNVING